MSVLCYEHSLICTGTCPFEYFTPNKYKPNNLGLTDFLILKCISTPRKVPSVKGRDLSLHPFPLFTTTIPWDWALNFPQFRLVAHIYDWAAYDAHPKTSNRTGFLWQTALFAYKIQHFEVAIKSTIFKIKKYLMTTTQKLSSG